MNEAEKLIVVTDVDSRELVVGLYTREKFLERFREEWVGLEEGDEHYDEFDPTKVLAEVDAQGPWYSETLTVSEAAVTR